MEDSVVLKGTMAVNVYREKETSQTLALLFKRMQKMEKAIEDAVQDLETKRAQLVSDLEMAKAVLK